MDTAHPLTFALRKTDTTMIDLQNVSHHKVIEEIVDVLTKKTQNTDKGFFRVEVAYFIGKLAGCMRATVVSKDRGELPVNIYALALATSGYGKGHSVGVMENEFIKGFSQRFRSETLPLVAEKHLWEIANDRAIANNSDPQAEFDVVEGEYRRAGAYAFTFDSATVPAVKQLRHKLLLANAGSINLQIDEIGLNFMASAEVLTLFLELYDQGLVKQKLTKNTAENQRAEELDGKSPTNLLMFGTPSKLFDGGQTEDMLYDFLETGYGRRCLFSLGTQDRKAFHTQTAAEIYANLTMPSNTAVVDKWANKFHDLADPSMYGWQMQVPDAVGILNLEYKIACEKAADLLADHEDIKKAELSHRYFKALKLSGALAFVDQSIEITEMHLKQAILLVEESGQAFQKILNREKTYEKLAKYIASVDGEVTHADLHEALPFYKTGNAARNEMMTLATAWGYKKHIVIKKSFVDGIEFFRGETLKETKLDELILSYSSHFAYDYEWENAPFDMLEQLLTMDVEGAPMHWANHRFTKKHRAEENVIAGFNMIVLDIDGGARLEMVHELLKDYKFITQTTKRHTDEEHRFRLIIPINYHLELDADDYKQFMENILEWLPVKVDEQANQRSRKWETNPNGKVHRNDEGEILDVLKFIPKTSKNEQHRAQMEKVVSMDNLERWFAQRMVTGSRNNHMIKFALALVDGGMELYDVQKAVLAFNAKLNNPLAEDEIQSTIMVTVAKKFHR